MWLHENKNVLIHKWNESAKSKYNGMSTHSINDEFEPSVCLFLFMSEIISQNFQFDYGRHEAYGMDGVRRVRRASMDPISITWLITSDAFSIELKRQRRK